MKFKVSNKFSVGDIVKTRQGEYTEITKIDLDMRYEDNTYSIECSNGIAYSSEGLYMVNYPDHPWNIYHITPLEKAML